MRRRVMPKGGEKVMIIVRGGKSNIIHTPPVMMAISPTVDSDTALPLVTRTGTQSPPHPPRNRSG